MEVREPSVVDHRASSTGRWLRARRLKIALWIAVAEALLIVIHVIPKWPALIIAALLVGLYVLAGRSVRNDTARQGAWIVGASQALVVLFPILVAIVGTFTLIAIGALAVVGLIVLFSDRR
jgi:hypothetical protein